MESSSQPIDHEVIIENINNTTVWTIYTYLHHILHVQTPHILPNLPQKNCTCTQLNSEDNQNDRNKVLTLKDICKTHVCYLLCSI